jgi:hypothetical protein
MGRYVPVIIANVKELMKKKKIMGMIYPMRMK